jgi:hypothetical protein
MMFDANIDANGDRTNHSNHHTEVIPSLHTQQVDTRNSGYCGGDTRTGPPTGKSADTITTVTPPPTRPPAGHILAQGRRGAQEEGEAHQGGH